MKAQVVVFDRAACVAYHDELVRQLEAAGRGDEVAVVMTVGTSKDEDPDWRRFALTEHQEEELLDRFRTHGDPLKFLIVTSKLGTGFDAPIEGVMYLDKPMKDHTLFQTITRVNRRWRNPETGQEKKYGLIVDYVNLGDAFAKAMRPANPDQAQREIDTDGLIDRFEAELDVAMLRFAGLDHTEVGTQTLMDAQKRLPTEHREAFAQQYLMLHGIWEAVAPDTRLDAHKAAYRFLSQVYTSITPSGGRDELIWHRLGAKTIGLVHSHMSNVRISPTETVVVADADTLAKLRAEGTDVELPGVEGKTADEVIDTIAERLKRRLEGEQGDHPIYRSIAERLDRLRERVLDAAENSIEWLRSAFAVAKDLKTAERAEDEAGKDGLDLLPNPHIGALTQIFVEYAPADTPEMVSDVVHEIDEIVREVSFDGWTDTAAGDRAVRQNIRLILKKYRMHTVPGLFDRAYDYIAAHY